MARFIPIPLGQPPLSSTHPVTASVPVVAEEEDDDMPPLITPPDDEDDVVGPPPSLPDSVAPGSDDSIVTGDN